MQRETNLLIAKAPISRLVREIVSHFRGMAGLRFQAGALEAVQEACEYHLIRMFEFANMAAIHAKRVTIQRKDIELVRKMCDGWVMIDSTPRDFEGYDPRVFTY